MINADQIQQELKRTVNIFNPRDFLCAFLRCYKFPDATLIMNGLINDITYEEEVFFANRLFFCYTKSDNLYVKFDNICHKNKCHFVLIINDEQVLCYDLRADEWLDCKRKDLYKFFNFFLSIIGLEKKTESSFKKHTYKTSEKLAHLYNELLICNPEHKKDLDVFFIGMISCFIAENRGFIKKNAIKTLVTLYTHQNGSDISSLFDNVFKALRGDKNTVPEYVCSNINRIITNFNFSCDSILFNEETYKLLLDILEYDLELIDPDFLGSVIQQITIAKEDIKYNYTNTANIYKVIGPLFMDDLYREFNEQKSGGTLDIQLLNKLSNIRIFDPACGSGNFLIVTYRELKNLENSIKKSLTNSGIKFENKQYVNIYNFFGIESNYIAATLTKVTLFFLNDEYLTPQESTLIPENNIINADPLEISWVDFCPFKDKEVYIIGNPSYVGARSQSIIQKQQIRSVFSIEIQQGLSVGDLDYASPWFYLAAQYMNKANSGFAFVTTNSLTQGIHVPTLWPTIFNQNMEIVFAHTSFKWKNEGKKTTAVTVVIIGCRKKGQQKQKFIFDNNISYSVQEISPYLTSGNVIIYKSNRTVSTDLPKMVKGNMPYGKELLLSPKEKNDLVLLYPEAAKYLKRVVGSLEFIHHEERWCLWINDEQFCDAYNIPLIAERIDAVREMRLKGDANAKKLADKPYKFRETNLPQKYTLVVPSVSSENRTYFQAGYVGKDVVVTNLCFVIYDAPAWVFGIIESKMHNLWVKTVCGGLETRPRYSNVLGYNTFPLPKLTVEQKKIISENAYNILLEREKFPEKSLMELYGDSTMPEGLKYAHQTLDTVVESCYNPKGFVSDQERLNVMFSLYKDIKGDK